MSKTLEILKDTLKNFHPSTSIGSSSGAVLLNTESTGPTPTNWDIDELIENVRRKIPIQQNSIEIASVLNVKKLDINYNNEEFRGLENFPASMETVVHDFEDDQPLLYEEAVLLEKVTVERIAEIGRETIPCLYSGFSQKTAAALFVLAYNLRYRKNKEFADAITDSPPNIVSDFAFDFFSDNGM